MHDSTRNPTDQGTNVNIDSGTTTHTWDDEQSFRRALFEALESTANIPLTEIDPVYDTVDIEGLERFITNSNSDDVFAVFSYGGCYVEIQGDGTIMITPFRQLDSP